MISIVNGYVCTTSCEAAAAKQGKDPSAPPGSPPGVSGKDHKASSFANQQQATVFDESLKGLTGANTSAPSDNAQQQAFDRFV
jgi:hypothetical protein